MVKIIKHQNQDKKYKIEKKIIKQRNKKIQISVDWFNYDIILNFNWTLLLILIFLEKRKIDVWDVNNYAGFSNNASCIFVHFTHWAISIKN